MTDKLERDAETGMVSRADFDKLIGYELELVEQEKRFFTLAVLDLDHFEQHVADVGEEQAALLLKKVGELLRAHSREGDVIGRGVGDQFLILMGMTRPEQGLFVVEDVRRLLASSTFKLKGKTTVKCTLSAGLASCPRDGMTRGELVWRAEAALWLAKIQGRNRVVLAAEEKMVLKSNYYPKTQVHQLQTLASNLGRTEASILREALADFLRRHEAELKDQRLPQA